MRPGETAGGSSASTERTEALLRRKLEGRERRKTDYNEDDEVLSVLRKHGRRSLSVVAAALHPTHTPIYQELFAGVLSGSLQVLLFNPYDRALYLSMTTGRPFMDRRNWGAGLEDLNRGVLPNLVQRIVSYGMYFPLEQMWTRALLAESIRHIPY